MTTEQAQALRQWIKDHDTRFEASVSGEGADVAVELRPPGEGTPVERVESAAQYGERFIEAHDPGPTIREAWERWKAEGN